MYEARADDRFSRYLFSGSDFAASNGRVKHGAFLRAPKDGKTSVFHTTRLAEAAIWGLADEHVVPLRHRALLGRADVTAHAVHKLSLKLERSEPPPRHWNIAGWPADKSDAIEQAHALAARATLVLRKSA